jgi:hypothetical protein
MEHDGLAVAILDHVLRDGDSTRLCERLTDRGIPFVIYNGFNKVDGACKAGVLVGSRPLEKRSWRRWKGCCRLNQIRLLAGSARAATSRLHHARTNPSDISWHRRPR